MLVLLLFSLLGVTLQQDKWRYIGIPGTGTDCRTMGAPADEFPVGRDFWTFCYQDTGSNATGYVLCDESGGIYTSIRVQSCGLGEVCCDTTETCGTELSTTTGRTCCEPMCGDPTGPGTNWGKVGEVVGAVFAGIFTLCILVCVVAVSILLCVYCGTHFKKLKATPIFWEEDENLDAIEVKTLSEFRRSGYDYSDEESEELEAAPDFGGGGDAGGGSADTVSAPRPGPGIVVQSSQPLKGPAGGVQIQKSLGDDDRVQMNIGVVERPKLNPVIKMRPKAEAEIIKGAANPRPNSVGKYYNFGNLRNVFEKSPPQGAGGPPGRPSAPRPGQS